MRPLWWCEDAPRERRLGRRSPPRPTRARPSVCRASRRRVARARCQADGRTHATRSARSAGCGSRRPRVCRMPCVRVYSHGGGAQIVIAHEVVDERCPRVCIRRALRPPIHNVSSSHLTAYIYMTRRGCGVDTCDPRGARDERRAFKRAGCRALGSAARRLSPSAARAAPLRRLSVYSVRAESPEPSAREVPDSRTSHLEPGAWTGWS